MTPQYEFHPLCLLFPQADERTIADMAVDIKKNGLNEVLLWRKILPLRTENCPDCQFSLYAEKCSASSIFVIYLYSLAEVHFQPPGQ